jgi:hypothetical protein
MERALTYKINSVAVMKKGPLALRKLSVKECKLLALSGNLS